KRPPRTTGTPAGRAHDRRTPSLMATGEPGPGLGIRQSRAATTKHRSRNNQVLVSFGASPTPSIEERGRPMSNGPESRFRSRIVGDLHLPPDGTAGEGA